MKKSIVGGLGLLGLLLASHGFAANPGGAAPPPAQPPQQAPGAGLAAVIPLKVTSVTRAPDLNGVFQIDVAVENNSTASFVRPYIELRGQGVVSSALQLVELAAKATHHFVFPDAAGPALCNQTKPYEIWMSSALNDHNASVSKFSITTSNCSFTTKVDVASHGEPVGSAFITAASVEGAVTCSAPLVVKATVVNHVPLKAGQGLHVGLKENGVQDGISGPFTVNPNGTQSVIVTASPQAVKKAVDVVLIDSQNSLGGHIPPVSGFSVEVHTSCNYTFNDGTPVILPVPR